MERRCSLCNTYQDLEKHFYKDKTRKYGRAGICKTCTSTKRNKHRYQAKVRGDNRESRKRSSKKYRDLVLKVLGAVCICCGDDFAEYLEIDHINGGGKKHREQLKGSQGVYRELLRDPRSADVQILCANCHRYKTRNNKLCRDRHTNEI